MCSLLMYSSGGRVVFYSMYGSVSLFMCSAGGTVVCSVFMCSTEGGVMCLLVICSIGIGTVVLFMCFYLRLYSVFIYNMFIVCLLFMSSLLICSLCSRTHIVNVLMKS